MKLAKNVKQLEKKYGVPVGEFDRMNVEVNKIPEHLRILMPYVEYFCVNYQEEREEFYDLLPQKVWIDLHKVVGSLFDPLLDWLTDKEFPERYKTKEWEALQLLDEESEWRGKVREPSTPPPPLTEKEVKLVNEILKLDEAGLRKRWNIPEENYKRYDYKEELFPDDFKPLFPLIRLLAIEDKKSIIEFIGLCEPITFVEIELVKRLVMTPEMRYWDGRCEATAWESSVEAFAKDRLYYQSNYM